MLRVDCNKEGIKKAIRNINEGKIIIFPTDTIYGIGCDPYNAKAVKKIYEIKARDISKPLPVLVHSISVAQKIAFFDEFTRKIAEKFWPGPLTIILQLTDNNLKKTLNLEDKIALRVPNNKCTLELLKKCNFLVGTSANISGQTSFTDPNQCPKEMDDYDVFLDGGIIENGIQSTIIEIKDEKIKIIRNGHLSPAMLKL